MARHNELETTSLRGKLARRVLAALLLVLPLAVAPCFAHPAQQQGGHPRFENNQQPHLGTWLQRHQNLTPEQQEKALQSEPGFKRATPRDPAKAAQPPAAAQQNASGTAAAVCVDHIEAMEHLTPQMRQQVRASIQEFRTLPPDRQRLMRKAFRDLREYPPEQRTAMMNSPKFQAQFSPQERSILGNILAVEPYQAVHGPRPDDGLENGR